jgi:hypothetical protein
MLFLFDMEDDEEIMKWIKPSEELPIKTEDSEEIVLCQLNSGAICKVLASRIINNPELFIGWMPLPEKPND